MAVPVGTTYGSSYPHRYRSRPSHPYKRLISHLFAHSAGTGGGHPFATRPFGPREEGAGGSTYGTNPFNVSPTYTYPNDGSSGGSTSTTTTTTGGSGGASDPYAGLFAQLAQMRDAQLAQLRGDLSGRINAIGGIINSAYAPLRGSYGRAIQSSEAVNSAVANRLAAEGGTENTDLLSKLSQINAPDAATQDVAGQVSKYYGGLSNANYAADSGTTADLVSQLAAEEGNLAKQPALYAGQLTSEYAKNAAGVLSDYMQQAFGLKKDQADNAIQAASAQADRDAQEAAHKEDLAAAAAEHAAQNAKDAEASYWDNYWRKQDLLFKRWQTNVASGNQKAANKARIDMAKLQHQSAADIAKIRAASAQNVADTHAAATETSAQTHATATETAAQIRADAAREAAATKAANDAKSGKNNSNVSNQRAYTAALNAIIDPRSNRLRKGVTYGPGYTAERSMERIIDSTLRGFGINPNSPKGRQIRRSVMGQASNRRYSSNPRFKFSYDPNWGKKLKKGKKRTQSQHGHR